jgi:nitroimidazol reductase NimA-like FMN-containing flavoprotein (pyridoxamine 5'-phosphate oxidase superfamily)
MNSSIAEHRDFFESVRIPMRLACRTESDWPVVLSLWFLYEDGQLLCATGKSARVVSYLEQDDRCGFEIAGDNPPYCGVRGQARAQLDDSRGMEVLERLLVRYLGGTDNQLARTLLSRQEPETAIILEPVWVSSWNFSKRMSDVAPPGFGPDQKCCPSP